MNEWTDSFFSARNVFYGDIHNHCGISYGHGSLEEALNNAALQLDFVAVTGHAGWPDMDDVPMDDALVEYHKRGFEKLRRNWPEYIDTVERYNHAGSFVTFFSYEYHSFRHGDRTIVTPVAPATPQHVTDPEEFKEFLTGFDAYAERALLLPHHIGYRTGYRGVHWPLVTDKASPLVEIVSMHGLAEDDESAFFPYMHTMGPLNGANTVQAGLAAGHHFGFTGSTDHHAAHPGSYGYGRTGVWAENLSRESIWQALLDRRTYALTGDRMDVRFSVGGAPLGSQISVPPGPRRIEYEVQGGGAIDRVEVLKNNRVIHRREHSPSPPERLENHSLISGLVYLEVGWGPKGRQYDWELDVAVKDGTLAEVEPRLRGVDVVDPLETSERPKQFSSWRRTGENGVHLDTATSGNASPTTRQTQGLGLKIAGSLESEIVVTANGSSFSVFLSHLAYSSQTFYVAGFASPAVKLHRLVTLEERSSHATFEDDGAWASEDWYYLRVFQRNGHAAWTSPVWITR